MESIGSTRDLFLHELGDILYVEEKLERDVLPKLMEEATDRDLRKSFEKHLRETRGHVENVEEVFSKLGEPPKSEPCIGFEGLKSEHEQLLGEASPALVEMIDTAAAARVEHYEIAAYETLITMARGLGAKNVIELLERNLKEEKEALREVESAAKRLSKEPVAA